MNITVVGAGYVGLANAFLIGITDKVTLYDIDQNKIKKLQNGISPINDDYIVGYIDKVNLGYTIDPVVAYEKCEILIIATNTDYDQITGKFNLNSIESIMKSLSEYMKSGIVVIKSTIPVGYTEDLKSRFQEYDFVFSPEFLREGFALHDNLYPDRIVVGGDDKTSKTIMNLLSKNILSEDVELIYSNTTEAEVVKLFANTYLAMRVAYVNELDSYCQKMNVSTKNVLEAVGSDKRIGRQYFNPSFGYGGYCLPKDTKQMVSEFNKLGLEQKLMTSIVESNEMRKDFIVEQIIKKIEKIDNPVIGIYRLIAKKGINNFRSSAVVDIMNKLLDKGINLVVYEPLLEQNIEEVTLLNDLNDFSSQSDLILANRMDKWLLKQHNVYSVDVYNEN